MSVAGLEAIYHLHRTDLVRLLAARIGDVAEAEDIVQDLWLKARVQQDAQVSNSKAYLYRMAQNLLIDRLRERNRRMCRDRQWVSECGVTGTDLTHWGPSAEDILHERDDVERLARAIEKLPEGARKVFQLHKLDGLSHADVALQLQISRSGVEKHMAVAMKYLRRALLN